MICNPSHPRPASRRICTACHAKYMRQWRKTHPLTPEQRLKMVARSYSHVLVKRGEIKREPCKQCGSIQAQIHHKLYPNPWFIEWLCAPCHRALHQATKKVCV